jgi:Flp pilus assembly CpaE family ATPase
VLPADASPGLISAAVIEAVVALTPLPLDPSGLADPRAALPDLPREQSEPTTQVAPGSGRVMAVWGPTGAPGRTTVAVGLASELSALGWPTLLVDADVYGGVVAQVLGLLDESPGLAAACRLANNGALDLSALIDLARQVSPTLRVLTGIGRADRWPELRPAALAVVLSLATSIAAMTIVDCGFCLEQDEELSYDTMAPRRNGATLTLLEQADVVLAVGTADPVGLQRLVRGLAELKEAVPEVQPTVVVNRLRASAVPGNAEAEVRAALSRYAGIDDVVFVPLDVNGVDGAVAAGRTLTEAAAGSPVRQALQSLAASLVGAPSPAKKRRLLRR